MFHNIRLLCLLAVLCATDVVWAQQAATTDTAQQINLFARLPKVAVKFSPTSFIEPAWSYLQFGVEHVLSRRWHMSYEIGVCPNIGLARNQYSDGIGGVRARTDIRYYFEPDRKGKNFPFVALEAYGKRETWCREEWVQRGGGTYSQQFEVQHQRLAYGLNVLAGVKYVSDKQLTIDFLGGWGFKTKKLSANNLPADAVLGSNFEWFNFDRDGNYVNMVLGVKIGYVLLR